MELKDLIDVRADELRILNENEGVDVTKEALSLIRDSIKHLASAFKYMSVEGNAYGAGTPGLKLIEAEKAARAAKRKVAALKSDDIFEFTPEMKKFLSMAVNSINDALKNVDEKVIKNIVAPSSDADEFEDEIVVNEPAETATFEPLKKTKKKKSPLDTLDTDI